MENNPEIETIIKFLKQMSTQKNRGTAFPYFFTIRTSRWAATVEGSQEKDEYYSEDNEEMDPKNILEDECENDELSADPEENKDGKEKWAMKVPVTKAWENKGIFLTETDAKDHLRLNHYHYSKDAHTYVDHAWRAPELEAFLLALFKHFNVKPQGR